MSYLPKPDEFGLFLAGEFFLVLDLVDLPKIVSFMFLEKSLTPVPFKCFLSGRKVLLSSDNRF